MSDFKGIPVVVSGEKYTAPQGFNAIKDGIKHDRNAGDVPRGQKPKWLRAQLPSDPRYFDTLKNVKEHKLATVCEESKCPNIGECWSHGTATIMLMGAVCTRACRFCSVDTGNPGGWLDKDEPDNAANSVRLMNLKYIVLTSVDRDDLPDGGAQHYADCIRAIRDMNPDTAVEALTPDFQGRHECVETVVDSGLQVFAQNLETVRRLTHPVRDPRASYEQTLDVLRHAKQFRPDVLSKTSLMLGLGERDDEILAALDDMREAGLDIVTFGQYLRPTRNHLPVERYVTPDEFAKYREWGLERGFLEVVSGPLVRSSYRADQVFSKNNCGL
ncbi:lipoyl synthase [Oceanococcus atlanticus]|uniref:Lipoyl synthase n=1 Tax=Oceanococcus atlanticus TaxID=1317117 RepID=A0A1Y1SD55_9GAMM|nr:lipoyl synthase [Oceanococcus atlanticus]ORE86124.1 lipoyl synthase [Oceanococcus atlanticus]